MLSRALLAQARAEPAALAVACGSLWLTTGTYAAQAVLLAHALAAVVIGAGGQVVGLLAGVLAVALVRAGLAQWHACAAHRLGRQVRLRLRGLLLERALSPAHLHDQSNRDGVLRLSLTEGVEGVDTYVSKYLPALSQVGVLCPVLLAGIAWLSPTLAVVLTGCLVLALGAPRWWDRLLLRRGAEHWDSYEALAGDYLEALQGISTLRAIGGVERARAGLQDRSRQLHRATVRTLRASLVDTGLVDLAVQAGVVASAALAVLGAAADEPRGLSAPATYLVLLLSSEVLRPVRELSRQWHSGYLGVTSIGPITAVLDVDPGATTTSRRENGAPGESAGAETRAGRTPVPDAPAVEGTPPASLDGLVLHEVHFAYPGGSEVLNGATAHLSAGQVTAVVGSSGAGKSTLLDLLLGYLAPSSGSVTTTAGEQLDPAEVAVVSQETYLFAGTIADNLRAAWPNAGEDDLVAAARAAGVHEDIVATTHGYATAVGEGGTSLSGGQRQRVSFARALLARRPVLLLDEPTSALDDAHAAHLMISVRAYVAAAPGRLAVLVAHREETLAYVDRVLHLQGGLLEETRSQSHRSFPAGVTSRAGAR